MENLTCKKCGYFWKEDDEERATCHWVSRCPDDFAPCEEEDDISGNMPCDFTGFCGGTSCPNFFKCKGGK